MQRRHSVLYTLGEHVDDMATERPINDQPLQKRRTVEAYRASRTVAIERWR